MAVAFRTNMNSIDDLKIVDVMSASVVAMIAVMILAMKNAGLQGVVTIV